MRSQSSYIFSEPNQQQLAMKPRYIRIADPPIGQKCYVIVERGVYVFEEGPVSFRAMACTHAGSGGITVYDGVPDEDGFFPAEPKWTEKDFACDEDKIKAQIEYEIAFDNRNGKEVYYAHPACMGMWHLDAGCLHGLSIKNEGAHEASSPIVTVIWQPKKQLKAVTNAG